jgi:hypothetical protein
MAASVAASWAVVVLTAGLAEVAALADVVAVVPAGLVRKN